MDDEVSPVAALVAAAAAGDQLAWRDLVDRYSPLLVTVVGRFRLSRAEVEDVAQTVWLRLVEYLGGLKEPQALPSWIITTGRRETIRYLSTRRRTDPLDTEQMVAELADPADGLEQAERHEVLLAGLAELPSRQRELLLLLVEDPAPSYDQISERTGIPVGSIGPTRARALERLRRTPPVRAYLDQPSGGDRHDPAKLV